MDDQYRDMDIMIPAPKTQVSKKYFCYSPQRKSLTKNDYCMDFKIVKFNFLVGKCRCKDKIIRHNFLSHIFKEKIFSYYFFRKSLS